MLMTVISAIFLAHLLSARVLVAGAVSFTNSEYYIQEGQPFTITWTGNRGPVTVSLMKGPDANLQLVFVIVTGYEGQEYTWTPPPTLAADSYELQIEDAGSTDYSPRFRYPAPPVATTSSVVATNSGTAPTATNTQSSSTSTLIPASSTPSSDPDTSSTAPLSTAAKAAIATLGGLLGLAILAALVYCVHRRRRKRRNEREAAAAAASYELPPSETAWSPATTSATHMKVDANGMPYGPGSGGSGSVDGMGRAELPVRGWAEMVELSADGRYLR